MALKRAHGSVPPFSASKRKNERANIVRSLSLPAKAKSKKASASIAPRLAMPHQASSGHPSLVAGAAKRCKCLRISSQRARSISAPRTATLRGSGALEQRKALILSTQNYGMNGLTPSAVGVVPPKAWSLTISCQDLQAENRQKRILRRSVGRAIGTNTGERIYSSTTPILLGIKQRFFYRSPRT